MVASQNTFFTNQKSSSNCRKKLERSTEHLIVSKKKGTEKEKSQPQRKHNYSEKNNCKKNVKFQRNNLFAENLAFSLIKK